MKNRIIEIALTDLAASLDMARMRANDIEEAAPQDSVYGDISNALKKTLALLMEGDEDRAESLYESIVADGNTVRQALAIEAKEHAAALAEEQAETPGARIRKALDALALHGVTEKQVQTVTGINDEIWGRLTNSDNHDLAGVPIRELVTLADALFQDFTYLLTGTRARSLKYSPCTLTAMIGGLYPAAV